MASACTHSTLLVPPVASPRSGSGKPSILARARLRLAALAAALTSADVPAERAYGRLLEESGGKFTDALEREADRRLRGSWDAFPAP